MNRLPLEIEDCIWNLYWKDIFKDQCINYLNNTVKSLEKMYLFVKSNIYSTNIGNLNKKKLIDHNLFLEKIQKDKGLLLFLSKKNKKILKIFNNTNQDILLNLNLISSFCILFGPPYMEYYTLEKIKSISK